MEMIGPRGGVRALGWIFLQFFLCAGIAAAGSIPVPPGVSPRIWHTILATEHRLPSSGEWIEPQVSAILLGFTHVMNSALPGSLLGQLPELKNTGVTHLVLEVAQESADCDQYRRIARLPVGIAEPSALAQFRQDKEHIYGPDYFALLQGATRAGIAVICGETPLYATHHGNLFFHERNEYLAWTLLKLVESGQKPLLLIGAYHVNPVAALMQWMHARRAEHAYPLRLTAFHASELDGQFPPSRGVLYPDVDFLFAQFAALNANFIVPALQRDPQAGYAELLKNYP